MWSPEYYLEHNNYDVDAAIKEMTDCLADEINNEVLEHINNMINGRNLTEDESAIFDEWLNSEADDTGERLDIGDGSVETEDP